MLATTAILAESSAVVILVGGSKFVLNAYRGTLDSLPDTPVLQLASQKTRLPELFAAMIARGTGVIVGVLVQFISTLIGLNDWRYTAISYVAFNILGSTVVLAVVVHLLGGSNWRLSTVYLAAIESLAHLWFITVDLCVSDRQQLESSLIGHQSSSVSSALLLVFSICTLGYACIVTFLRMQIVECLLPCIPIADVDRVSIPEYEKSGKAEQITKIVRLLRHSILGFAFIFVVHAVANFGRTANPVDLVYSQRVAFSLGDVIELYACGLLGSIATQSLLRAHRIRWHWQSFLSSATPSFLIAGYNILRVFIVVIAPSAHRVFDIEAILYEAGVIGTVVDGFCAAGTMGVLTSVAYLFLM